jgi:hypothetical protein
MALTTHEGTTERGQVLVIVAGGLVGLMLAVGLVIDAGVAFLGRRDGQNVADIAALAGTRIVATNYTTATRTQHDVFEAIASAMTANGCSPTGSSPCFWTAQFVGAGASGPVNLATVVDVSSALPSGSLGIRVGVSQQRGTFIIGIIGKSSWEISTEATAIASRPAGAPVSQLLPIALKEDAAGYTPGQVYDLTDGKDAPGGFGFLSWTGSNDAGALATSLCTPDSPAFTMPTTFPADPGKTNADAVRDCLADWITTGQTVLIPIYDTVSGTGNSASYHIVGLAAFVVTSQEQPAVDNLQGYFVEVYPYTDVPAGVGAVAPTANDTTYFMGLIR